MRAFKIYHSGNNWQIRMWFYLSTKASIIARLSSFDFLWPFCGLCEPEGTEAANDFHRFDLSNALYVPINAVKYAEKRHYFLLNIKAKKLYISQTLLFHSANTV